MLSNKPINQIVFFTCKTVPQFKDFDSADPITKTLFSDKYQREIDERSFRMVQTLEKTWLPMGLSKATDEIYQEKAALSAEFGKIVVFSIAAINQKTEGKLNILTVSSDNEKQLLETLLKKARNTFGLPPEDATKPAPPRPDICGHCIKEFHWPMLAKKMVVHGIDLPPALDLSNLKKWDITFLHDTMDSWGMGKWKEYTSLDLLAYTLGVERSAEQISGKDIGSIYYSESADKMKTIEKFCADSVYTTAQVYAKMKGLKINLTR